MALAHLMGGVIRAFSTEKLAPEDRRDGAPFFLFLLSVFGAIFAWFLFAEPWAQTVHAFTFGLLFGQVAYGLPAVFFIYSFYLFRNPASVKDSGRFAVGFWLFLSVLAAFFHLYGGAPAPKDGIIALAGAGGLFGWEEFCAFLLLSTSPSDTVSRSVFGISIPIKLFPGIGARIRTSFDATA